MRIVDVQIYVVTVTSVASLLEPISFWLNPPLSLALFQVGKVVIFVVIIIVVISAHARSGTHVSHLLHLNISPVEFIARK
jgi:hypothetical protein